MNKLKDFIGQMPTDKLRHRVLGQFVNPLIFVLSIAFAYIIGIKWLAIPLALIGCAFFHYGVEVWQKKTNSGVYDIEDAKAGFSSVWGYALLVLIMQLV